MREALTPEQQEKWDGVVAEGASIYEFLRLTQEPTKKDWIKEFTKKANYKQEDNGELLEALYLDSQRKAIRDNAPEKILENLKKKNMRPVIKCAAIAFVISCLIVPWQYTADFNGNDGFHSRKPAGYSLLIDPPVNTERTNHGSERGFGVKIDFDRLLLEWLAMSGVTGLILFLRASRKGH